MKPFFFENDKRNEICGFAINSVEREAQQSEEKKNNLGRVK